jgi:uncharacterized protein (DUF2267 family)
VQYQEFVNRVAARSGLPKDRAEVATQLVLAVLGESIDGMETRDPASELPRQLKRLPLNVPQHGQRDLAREFVHQVAMREAVSRGQLADILAELFHDSEYAELWPEPAAEPSTAVPADGDVRLGPDEFLTRVLRRTGPTTSRRSCRPSPARACPHPPRRGAPRPAGGGVRRSGRAGDAQGGDL